MASLVQIGDPVYDQIQKSSGAVMIKSLFLALNHGQCKQGDKNRYEECSPAQEDQMSRDFTSIVFGYRKSQSHLIPASRQYLIPLIALSKPLYLPELCV